MEKIELKSCPFCGGIGILCKEPITQEALVWFVECSMCGAKAMEWPTPQGAVDAWESREKPSEREDV